MNNIQKTAYGVATVAGIIAVVLMAYSAVRWSIYLHKEGRIENLVFFHFMGGAMLLIVVSAVWEFAKGH